MALKRVHLDQRDWIALARQHYGVIDDDGLAGVLAMVREAAAAGRASFPLSATHYIETYRQGDPGRRRRLGAFMAEISRLHTIASPTDLLRAELHVAVCSVAGIEPRYRPVPFGRGAKHAFGEDRPGYFTDLERERQAIAQWGADQVFEFFETALITGPDVRLPADGIALPSSELAKNQLDLELETADKLRKWGHTSDRAHRLVLAQESADMIELLNAVTAEIGYDLWSVCDSREAFTDFMLSLPAKGTICRLRMSGHEDQTFRWHIGDLNDMTALGTAAAYCDVVVGENHWSSILRRHSRHSRHLRADVTSNLLDLPRLLLQSDEDV